MLLLPDLQFGSDIKTDQEPHVKYRQVYGRGVLCKTGIPWFS